MSPTGPAVSPERLACGESQSGYDPDHPLHPALWPHQTLSLCTGGTPAGHLRPTGDSIAALLNVSLLNDPRSPRGLGARDPTERDPAARQPSLFLAPQMVWETCRHMTGRRPPPGPSQRAAWVWGSGRTHTRAPRPPASAVQPRAGPHRPSWVHTSHTLPDTGRTSKGTSACQPTGAAAGM